MSSNMNFIAHDVTENIKANKASSSLATYYLLLSKVKLLMIKIEPKKVNNKFLNKSKI